MADSENKQPPDRILKPLMAAMATFACQFQLGAMLGQSSTMLPQLEQEDSPIKITKEYASWIASTGVIGTPISCIIAGPLCDKLGRKSMIGMHLLLSAIGHTIVGVSSNVNEILIGRVILSVAAGFGFPSLVYIPEICTPAQRSVLLYTCTVSSSLGLVYIYTIGGILNWDIASLITSSIAILALIYTYVIPESPPWLFQNHRLNDTIDSLKWLKGDNVNIEKELKALKDACSEKVTADVSVFDQFLTPTVIKPFLVLLTLAFLQNASGFYILLYYSVDFFDEFQTSYDPRFVAVGFGVTRLISCTIASIIISRLNRKILGSISGFSMGGILAVIYAYLYMYGDNKAVLMENSLLPVICLVSYIFACGLGVHPLPWLMIFELYPLNVRGRMCGVSNAMNYVFTFIFIKLYYVFMYNFHIGGTVLLFLVASVIFGLFSVFVLPETQGKSLIEIEEGFMPIKKKVNASAIV